MSAAEPRADHDRPAPFGDAIDGLQRLSLLVADTVERVGAQTGAGTDHDGLVRVYLTDGGEAMRVHIDPALLDAGAAPDLEARIAAAYRVAYQAVVSGSAEQGRRLDAYGAELLDRIGPPPR